MPIGGHHSANQSSPSTSETRRLVMVSVGISLFIAGFLVTLSSSSDRSFGASNGDDASRSPEEGFSSSIGTNLLVGIFVSLSGVILATVGPAVGIVKGKA